MAVFMARIILALYVWFLVSAYDVVSLGWHTLDDLHSFEF